MIDSFIDMFSYELSAKLFSTLLDKIFGVKLLIFVVGISRSTVGIFGRLTPPTADSLGTPLGGTL